MLAILVVACPCALGIAAPLATALAVAKAARAGALVRGGDVLERLGRLDVIFLDKTGTVTAGQPVVAAIEPVNSTPPDEILAWLAGLESASEHALGRAVVEEARARGLAPGSAVGVQVLPGLGIRGLVTRGGVTREVSAGTSCNSSARNALQMGWHAQASFCLVAQASRLCLLGTGGTPVLPKRRLWVPPSSTSAGTANFAGGCY